MQHLKQVENSIELYDYHQYMKDLIIKCDQLRNILGYRNDKTNKPGPTIMSFLAREISHNDFFPEGRDYWSKILDARIPSEKYFKNICSKGRVIKALGSFSPCILPLLPPGSLSK